MLNIYDSRGPSTPTSIGHDPAMPHVLACRHRNVSGRMTDTVLGRYHTKNSAFDSMYDEVSGLILPHNVSLRSWEILLGLVGAPAEKLFAPILMHPLRRFRFQHLQFLAHAVRKPRRSNTNAHMECTEEIPW